jgi:septal ring factor EnvC (AmiA/AmiB activator)
LDAKITPDTVRAAGRPNRSVHRRRPRRRRDQRPAILVSILAVLALVGCVMAILMLATQPTAARLEREIGTLSRRLAADQGQLDTLRAEAGRTEARDGALSRQLRRTADRMAGLQRTVHGLQGVTAVAQEQAVGLRDCVPQLQQELAGLVLETRSVAGRVTSVGLRNPILLSAPCHSLFSGL